MLLTRWFGWLLAALLLAGCAPDGLASLSRLQTPRSLSDLLVNVKEVTRSGVILEDDFYTENSLKRVFGGTVVNISVAFNGRPTGAEVKGFPAWKEFKDPGHASVDAMVLSVGRSFDIHGGEQAILLVESNTATDLGFDQIERLFGKDWELVPPPIPPHPVTLPSGPIVWPSRPHGGAEIR